MPDPIASESDASLSSADAAAEALNRGSSTIRPDISPERSNSLDDAFESITGVSTKDGSVVDPEKDKRVGRENGDVKPIVQGEPTQEEKDAESEKEADARAEETQRLADEAANKDKPKAPVADKPATKKGLLGDIVDGEPLDETTNDPTKAYDDIQLRSDASTKTKESFATQRARAIERETIIANQLAEEKKTRLELEARLTTLEQGKGKPTPEIEAELKELREFRAARDVEGRPEFKEKFDTKIEANKKSVFELFKQEGMTEAVVSQLRNLSEQKLDEYLEAHVYPNLSASQRRFVDSKLFENTSLSDARAKELATAKADAEKILGEQKQLPMQRQIERDNLVANEIRPILSRLPYMHLQQVPATATPVEKQAIEASNKYALELQEALKTAIIDDSPSVAAQRAMAVPIARHLSTQLRAMTVRAEAAEAKVAAVAKASRTGRLGNASSPAGASLSPSPKVSEDSGDAFDRLFTEATGQKV